MELMGGAHSYPVHDSGFDVHPALGQGVVGCGVLGHWVVGCGVCGVGIL